MSLLKHCIAIDIIVMGMHIVKEYLLKHFQSSFLLKNIEKSVISIFFLFPHTKPAVGVFSLKRKTLSVDKRTSIFREHRVASLSGRYRWTHRLSPRCSSCSMIKKTFYLRFIFTFCKYIYLSLCSIQLHISRGSVIISCAIVLSIDSVYCYENDFFKKEIKFSVVFRSSIRIMTFFSWKTLVGGGPVLPHDHATLPHWRNTHFGKVRGELRRLYGGRRDFFQKRRRGEDQVVREE